MRTGQDAVDCFAVHRCVPKPVVLEMGSYSGVDASGTLVAVGTQGVQPGGGISASLGCKPSKNKISFFSENIRMVHPN